MKRLGPAVAVILLIVCLSTWGYAEVGKGSPLDAASTTTEDTAKTKEDERLPIHKQDQWQFFFAPYLWVPGMNVNTTISNHTSSVSQPWWDLLGKLFSSVIGGMGRVEVWKGRWGLFVDSYFTYLSGNVSDSAGKQIDLGRRLQIPTALVLNGDLKYIARAGQVNFGIRYLVGSVPLKEDQPLPVLSLEILGGGNYNNYSQYLKLDLDATLAGPFGRTRSRGGYLVSKLERSYLEPYLGLRLSLWLTSKALITFRGGLGGFGLAEDNNFDSRIELAFGYKVHRNIYAFVGYRARYEQASGDALSVNGWFHGPILGAMFAF